jgi:hypothetical protein
MAKPPARDDDPVHPNWGGIAFQATTDRSGIVVMPTCAQSAPPYSVLPIPQAVAVLGELRAVIYGLQAFDARSYFAHFLDELAEELADAISTCRPPPPDEPEAETPT